MFKFIWKYSKNQQIVLLLFTFALFPFLYLTLELPKRIINDAIGAGSDVVRLFGSEISQVGFLALLCGLFLISVLIHGLLKMRINTMKGVLAERMLRRLRYQLVTRLFRFPKPYFQRTSQAELVSMVTSESEPLGGMMGDAISQPVMQFGQMLTILVFLFLQSFWFGLAAISMIPLQAWLIPMLQKQVNILNKKRIKEVRKLAAEIGETATGSTTLRTNGGYNFRSARIGQQLGHLFFIRLVIYKKKFFMKFLNNFLSQLTPFFFFSIGGYLVIQGNVTIGALVAALAAYKDLSSPWKELLTYYTRAHEMAQRWSLVTEHFAPSGTLDSKLIAQNTDRVDRLSGDIVFKDVTAHDGDGIAVAKNLSVTFPQGGLIAVAAQNEEDRRAIAELLTRELVPSSGSIAIGGNDLATLHQDILAARIGWADSAPFLFAGTVRDNILMALQATPKPSESEPSDIAVLRHEARQSGNTEFLAEDNWLTPSLADMNDLADVYSWWLTMIEAMGLDREILRRGMGLKYLDASDLELATCIPDIRKDMATELKRRGMEGLVVPLTRSAYNVSAPLLQNILHAAPKAPITQRQLADHPEFLTVLRDTGLVQDVYDVAQKMIEALLQTFGSDGTNHPLFQRLEIDVQTYAETLKVNEKAKRHDQKDLKEAELTLLLAFPCLLRPRHIGQFISDEMQSKVVAVHESRPKVLADALGDLFEPLADDTYSAGLTLLQNAIFGMLEQEDGQKIEQLEDVVLDVIAARGLKAELAGLMFREETALGGTNLPRKVVETIGFARAAIKRPDIFVLDKTLGSYDEELRFQASILLRQEMPNATIIYLEESFRHPENFDVYLELDKGQFSLGTQMPDPAAEDAKASSETDLAVRLRALQKTEFFANLDRAQIRLLAFSAQWFEIAAGETVFEMGSPPSDGAYLITQGEADFILPSEDGSEKLIRTLGEGALVGELALIHGEPRSLSMKARTDISGLRIGGEEFLSVLKSDPQASFKILQAVTRYLSKPKAS